MESIQETESSNLHFLDYWRVIRSRKEIILAVMLLITLTGIAYTFTMPKIYKAEARILVHQDFLNVEVFGFQRPSSTYNPYFLRTQYEILKARPMLYKVIENLQLRELWGREYNDDGQPLTLDEAHGILEGSLNIEQYRDTSLIAIRVFREEPKEAARIANELATVYANQRLSLKRREIQDSISAMENELKKQQAKVAQAEQEVEQLREDLGINILRGGTVNKVTLQQLEADRIDAQVVMLT